MIGPAACPEDKNRYVPKNFRTSPCVRYGAGVPGFGHNTAVHDAGMLPM